MSMGVTNRLAGGEVHTLPFPSGLSAQKGT